MSTFSPWWPECATLPKDTTVYTLRVTEDRLMGGACDGLLCDTAWTEKEEVKSHHWWKAHDCDVEVLEMSADEYVGLHLQEVRGMNPFWSLGRFDFMCKWKEAD